MAKKYTDEFRRDAVRMATTSGLTRPQLSSDLGVGVSTLNKWVQQHQHDDLMSGPHEDFSSACIVLSHPLPPKNTSKASCTSGAPPAISISVREDLSFFASKSPPMMYSIGWSLCFIIAAMHSM